VFVDCSFSITLHITAYTAELWQHNGACFRHSNSDTASVPGTNRFCNDFRCTDNRTAHTVFIDISPYPENHSLWLGIVLLLLGFLIIDLGIYVYMSAELGSGPKDGLMIVIGKKLPKIPIGIIGILLWSAVTLIGWMLGSSVGIGTLLSIFGAGFIMHIFYDAIGFEPRKLKHKSLKETLKSLSGKCF
jgi:hypothetical protein